MRSSLVLHTCSLPGAGWDRQSGEDRGEAGIAHGYDYQAVEDEGGIVLDDQLEKEFYNRVEITLFAFDLPRCLNQSKIS